MKLSSQTMIDLGPDPSERVKANVKKGLAIHPVYKGGRDRKNKAWRVTHAASGKFLVTTKSIPAACRARTQFLHLPIDWTDPGLPDKLDASTIATCRTIRAEYLYGDPSTYRPNPRDYIK